MNEYMNKMEKIWYDPRGNLYLGMAVLIQDACDWDIKYGF